LAPVIDRRIYEISRTRTVVKAGRTVGKEKAAILARPGETPGHRDGCFFTLIYA